LRRVQVLRQPDYLGVFSVAVQQVCGVAHAVQR
jgi:hypothetical protein